MNRVFIDGRNGIGEDMMLTVDVENANNGRQILGSLKVGLARDEQHSLSFVEGQASLESPGLKLNSSGTVS